MTALNDVTAYCLMSNARAARMAIRTGEIIEAWYCLATIYNIAAYAACQKIAVTAVEEALRIQTEINAANAGRPFKLTRPDAKVIPFPRRGAVVIQFPTPTPTK